MTHTLPVPQSVQLHVAVVGAGIAGLACAQALVAAGALVQVFEKSRGVSGRMSTRRGEGWQCDHGAQYFTAREPAFRAEVQRWIDAGAAALWTPEMRVYDGAEAGRFTSHSSRVDRFVGTPGMTAPGRLLAASLCVHCNATVDSLQRTHDRWFLHTAEGGRHETSFDIVLLAMLIPGLWVRRWPWLMLGLSTGGVALMMVGPLARLSKEVLEWAAKTDASDDKKVLDLAWVRRNLERVEQGGFFLRCDFDAQDAGEFAAEPTHAAFEPVAARR